MLLGSSSVFNIAVDGVVLSQGPHNCAYIIIILFREVTKLFFDASEGVGVVNIDTISYQRMIFVHFHAQNRGRIDVIYFANRVMSTATILMGWSGRNICRTENYWQNIT